MRARSTRPDRRTAPWPAFVRRQRPDLPAPPDCYSTACPALSWAGRPRQPACRFNVFWGGGPAATSRRLTLRRRRAAPAFAAQQGQLVRVGVEQCIPAPENDRPCARAHFRRFPTASALRASGFPSDVTVFDDLQLGCANWLTPAFRRYPAEHLYGIEAAHNPEVAGSNPAPATQKGPGSGAFFVSSRTSILA